MLWSRRLCPFGLPDEAEGIDNIVLASIGHFLRAATADDAATPLPVRFVSLLGQLERQERIARAARDASPRRRPRASLRDPAGCGAPRLRPPDRRIDGNAAGKVLATP